MFRGALDDDVTTVAASIAFFVMLAVFPTIAAAAILVSIFVDPAKLEALVSAYSDLIPSGSASVVLEQIRRLSEAASGPEHRVLTLTPYAGFAVLLWSTNKGTKALFKGLNTIFGCKETRGFIVFTAVTLAFTVGAIVFLLFSLAAVLFVPGILSLLGVSGGYAHALGLLRWLALFLVATATIAVIFRYGPDRRASSWRSIFAGSGLAALIWIGSSVLLSWYVSSFGRFAALYGSLSAVIGFMIWIWLTSIAVLIGAELDDALMSNEHGMGEAPENIDRELD